MVFEVAEVLCRMVRQWFPTGGQMLSMEQQGTNRRLGNVVMTPRAQATLASHEVTEALIRHMRGDDGDLEDFARREPERRAMDGFRRLSVFRAGNGGRFWIITEANRSRTTVLLPEDF